MTDPKPHRRQANIALAAVVSAIAAGSALLYRFPPETSGFYPQCPFHALTGLLCPGCGATRAFAALVHGNLASAFHFNPLITLLLPVLAIYATVAFRRAAWPRIPNAAVIALLAVTLIFTVARNLA